MQLFKLVFIAALALILAAGYVSAAPQPLEDSVIESRAGTPVSGELEIRDESGMLVERQGCAYNGCRCQPGTSGGLYCGWCPSAVTYTGTVTQGLSVGPTAVYQCNSSGGCCNYGRRVSCADYQGPCGG